MRRPSAGSIVAWLRQRLRDLRYVAGDLVYTFGQALRPVGRLIVAALRPLGRLLVSALRFVGRFFRATGSALDAFWAALSVAARRRLLAAALAAAAAVAFVELAVPALPCQFPAGDRCPPSDDAAEVVPADSLAYVHVNIDPDTEQYEDLTAAAARVPLFAQQIATRGVALIPGPAGAAPDFAAEIDPWFSGEAALSVLGGTGGVPEQVLLLEVSDPDGAREYADSIAAGRPSVENYRGVEISSDERDLASALVEDFLVIGSADSVRAIVDTATGAEGAAPLADDETAEDVRDELPDHRFVEAWISTVGATDLVAGDDGTLGSLAPLISPGTTNGAAVSISAGEDSFELAVRSALDPEREKSSPGFFAAFPGFDPSLPEDLPSASLAYLGVGEPRRTVSALLGQAAAEAPGIASGFTALVERLRSRGDIDIEADLLPALGDEAAVAIGPGPGGDAPAGGLPYLEFVAKGVDEEGARRALASLQAPLVDEIGSDLQAPVFDELDVAGVDARTLRISPTLEITYAAFEGLAVVATNSAAIAQLVEGSDALDSRDAYERVTEDFPDQVSLLAFFDLSSLLAEGFEIGLAQVPAFNTFADDFRALGALGVAVSTEGATLATDARLLLGERNSEALTSPPDD